MYLNDKRKIRLHMKEAGFLLNHLNGSMSIVGVIRKMK